MSWIGLGWVGWLFWMGCAAFLLPLSDLPFLFLFLAGPDDDEDDKPSAGAIAKRRGKLTKAERNKQRRRRQAEHAQRRAAEQKAVVKQVCSEGMGREGCLFMCVDVCVCIRAGIHPSPVTNHYLSQHPTDGPRSGGGQAARQG